MIFACKLIKQTWRLYNICPKICKLNHNKRCTASTEGFFGTLSTNYKIVQHRNNNKMIKLRFKLYVYSDNQKIMEYEDDFLAILRCIWCCFKANSFTSHLLNHKLSEIGLFTLHKILYPMHIGLFKVINWV